jgi:hypothetical protein
MLPKTHDADKPKEQIKMIEWKKETPLLKFDPNIFCWSNSEKFERKILITLYQMKHNIGIKKTLINMHIRTISNMNDLPWRTTWLPNYSTYFQSITKSSINQNGTNEEINYSAPQNHNSSSNSLSLNGTSNMTSRGEDEWDDMPALIGSSSEDDSDNDEQDYLELYPKIALHYE